MTMPAWYMDMWVNAPLPVMSPSAHTPGAARMWSSTGMARRLSSMPTAPAPTAARSARRPVATSSASPVSSSAAVQGDREAAAGGVSDRGGRAAGPHRDALPAEHPGQQVPGLGLLQRQQPARALDDRSPGCRTARRPARVPRRRRRRRAPPARPAPARPRSPRGWSRTACPPGPGSAAPPAVVPVAMTMPRRARSTCACPAAGPPAGVTVTSPGAVIRPCPRTRIPPLPVNRSAATLSSQSSVASSRIRRATGAQSGTTSRTCPPCRGSGAPR